LIKLAATSLSAAILASYPIVQYASSSTSTRTKSDGSLVTDADGDAQRIIFGLLHRTFPNVRIVGEESEEDMARGQVGLLKSLHETSEATDAATTGTAPTNGTATSFSPGTKRKWKEMEEDREGTILVTIEKEIALRVSTHLKNNKNDKDDDAKDNDDEKDKIFVDPSRVSVFVDPLDGTSAYAKGQYKFVTILIAIMVDNVPVFGVICKPFGDEDGLTSFSDTDHSAMYGGTLLGGVFCVGGGELERSRVHNANAAAVATAVAVANDTCTVKAKTNGDKDSTNCNGTTKIENGDSKEHLKRRRAIISKSKAGGVVQECIQSLSSKNLLHPEPLYITGAGYKTLVLLLGQKEETLWFFPKPGTSLWDVAAADALLRATGGRLTDSLNQDLDYSKSRTEASNDNGIVACCDSELHATCMELYESEKWKDE
jgi:3'-phosphoadenosine 5'-phosphosulfate (PAPS) 3'-phosphatase